MTSPIPSLKAAMAAAALTVLAAPVLAQDTSPDQLLSAYEAEAGASADLARGQALFTGQHTGGKPDTPSCTTCHTMDPRAKGQARTGKVIEPLAPGANPERFTETAKVEKWFGRNCNSVLGRDCTALEKADLIAWLSSL
ncbi:DUF1924 domain-containing protein [Celeribacter neptunius]|uniref:Cytochrome c domain-containing protein n=1 Tax=Celeribacter neptunius TaxID=588602 RepID=A0A1I3R2F8_9RHOB|nr:DUF1924 domain-containing protein [Celeribacter neptunius]SFJ39661.1 protein of unknown function [Celeribacter neptunius]